jgi:hypothetical protein
MTWLSSPPHNHAVWFFRCHQPTTHFTIIITITASSSLNIIYPHSCVAALFPRFVVRGLVVSLSRPFVLSSFPPFGRSRRFVASSFVFFALRSSFYVRSIMISVLVIGDW